MCYMTTHVQINNKTYLHTSIPTGIKTKFNTCEIYLIARSRLFQSLVITVAFLHCNSHRVSIRSILHAADLIIRLKSSTGIFIFNYNMDMHLLPSRDPPQHSFQQAASNLELELLQIYPVCSPNVLLGSCGFILQSIHFIICYIFKIKTKIV